MNNLMFVIASVIISFSTLATDYTLEKSSFKFECKFNQEVQSCTKLNSLIKANGAIPNIVIALNETNGDKTRLEFDLNSISQLDFIYDNDNLRTQGACMAGRNCLVLSQGKNMIQILDQETSKRFEVSVSVKIRR